jgi:hypothetical protein
VSRLKRGLFVIVPPELRTATEYSENPYLIARYLAGSAPHKRITEAMETNSFRFPMIRDWTASSVKPLIAEESRTRKKK